MEARQGPAAAVYVDRAAHTRLKKQTPGGRVDLRLNVARHTFPCHGPGLFVYDTCHHQINPPEALEYPI